MFIPDVRGRKTMSPGWEETIPPWFPNNRRARNNSSCIIKKVWEYGKSVFFLFPTSYWNELFCKSFSPTTLANNCLLSLMFLDGPQVTVLDGFLRHSVGAPSLTSCRRQRCGRKQAWWERRSRPPSLMVVDRILLTFNGENQNGTKHCTVSKNG